MAKKALITGLTGQDGSYLAEHLLDTGFVYDGRQSCSAVSGVKAPGR